MQKDITVEKQTRLVVAKSLLATGCVQVRTEEPFRLPSGWASPVYMDCRILISFPEMMRQFVNEGLKLLKESGCFSRTDSVAGAESSGIALAAWFSQMLNLPMQYVRKQTRGLGRDNQTVGVAQPGNRVLLIDDLMAGGYSMLNFYKGLDAAGLSIKDVFVIFNYGTFPTAQLLEPLDLNVHYLATWQDVFEVMQQSDDYSPAVINELGEFLADPVQWSHRNNGYPRAI